MRQRGNGCAVAETLTSLRAWKSSEAFGPHRSSLTWYCVPVTTAFVPGRRAALKASNIDSSSASRSNSSSLSSWKRVRDKGRETVDAPALCR
jgi:hypothetical protein